jgi:Right handed beta helix region
MPDRPEGDHRRRRLSARLRAALILLALLLLAASAATAGAVTARGKGSTPSVSQFAFSPKSFPVGAALASTKAQRATTIRFHVSRRSTVAVTIARKSAGRRSRGRCVRATAKLARKPACARYVTRGKLVRSGLRAGDRSIGFSGRLGGAALSPGQYRATIFAIDSRHHRSRARATTFTVKQGQSSNSGTPPAGSSGGLPSGPQRRVIKPCTVTLPNVGALSSAVASAAPGSVVCLAPGNYGKLSVTARPAGDVTIQPNGIATIAGASLSGSHLVLEGFNIIGDEVTVQPGSDHITVQFNYITGGYFGVDAGPTTTTTVNDVVIRGNKLAGPYGEDAIRLNRYHDSDGDGIGALIEGNEITGVRENGNHSDCLQAVWVGDHLVYRNNYLHDNRCQGFFVKDQQSPVDGVIADNNLMLRNAAPCAQAGCGQPSIFQVFGPITSFVMTRNTIWTPEGESPTTLRDPGWGSVQVANNVVYRFWSDTSSPFQSYTASNNVAAKREMNWPATGISMNAHPPFANPAADDYRTNDGRGVTWAPADQHYGP